MCFCLQQIQLQKQLKNDKNYFRRKVKKDEFLIQLQ